MDKDLFRQTKAIEILTALREGSKQVVELHGDTGGSISTLQARLTDLIKEGYISERVGKKFPFERVLQLTPEGKRIAQLLAHMDVSIKPAKMPSRRKWILAMIHSFGDVSITKLQKLLFLLTAETDAKIGPDFYLFRWYKFGPFCEDIDTDVRKLELDGIIETKVTIFGRDEQGDEIRKTSFRLSDRGSEMSREILKELGPSAKKQLALLEKYARMSVGRLVDDVHNRYEDKFEDEKNV